MGLKPCLTLDKIGVSIKGDFMRSLSLFFLLLGLIACERTEVRKEKFPDGKLKVRWEVTTSTEGDVRNGVYEEFYPNGETKLICNYSDNREHGVYRSYFENGNMESEIYYQEGKIHGDFREWYSEGGKKRFSSYKKGELHGTETTWDVSGNKVSDSEFKKGVCIKGSCKSN